MPLARAKRWLGLGRQQVEWARFALAVPAGQMGVRPLAVARVRLTSLVQRALAPGWITWNWLDSPLFVGQEFNPPLGFPPCLAILRSSAQVHVTKLPVRLAESRLLG